MNTPTAPRLTVADLKALLAGRPDDELVTVYVNGWYYHATAETPDTDEGLETTVVFCDPASPYDSRFDG